MIDSPRVCVQVQSVYIESQSTPDEERFVFAYTVTIRNLGRMPVQLLGRYWLITNGNGREIEVQGEGVVVTNTAAQGYPVPVLYGRRRIGGAIISAGIYIEDQQ